MNSIVCGKSEWFSFPAIIASTTCLSECRMYKITVDKKRKTIDVSIRRENCNKLDKESISTNKNRIYSPTGVILLGQSKPDVTH